MRSTVRDHRRLVQLRLTRGPAFRADLPPRRLRLVRIHYTRPTHSLDAAYLPSSSGLRSTSTSWLVGTGRRGQRAIPSYLRPSDMTAVRAGHTVRLTVTCRLTSYRAMAQARVDHSTDKNLPLLPRPGPAHRLRRTSVSPQDDPTAVHRPLRAGHCQDIVPPASSSPPTGLSTSGSGLFGDELHPGKQRPRTGSP